MLSKISKYFSGSKSSSNEPSEFNLAIEYLTVPLYDVNPPPIKILPSLFTTILLTKSLAPVDEALEGKEYLIGNFSAADIMLGHACFMSNRMGCIPDEMSNLKKYVENITNRPAFKIAIEMQ